MKSKHRETSIIEKVMIKWSAFQQYQRLHRLKSSYMLINNVSFMKLTL